MIFTAFAKALAQLPERKLRWIVLKTFGGTLVVLIALWLGVGAIVDAWLDIDSGWLATLVGLLGSALAVVLTLVLYAPAATLVASLFQDEAADAVEARHYPELGPAPGLPIAHSVLAAVRLVVWTIVVNLLCLPLYLLPVANVMIFFAVNGYLLSREYFEVVALRRMSRAEAAAFRRRHRLALWLAGIAVAVMFWVPLLNLLTPILGTAMMVHVIESRRHLS